MNLFPTKMNFSKTPNIPGNTYINFEWKLFQRLPTSLSCIVHQPFSMEQEYLALSFQFINTEYSSTIDLYTDSEQNQPRIKDQEVCLLKACVGWAPNSLKKKPFCFRELQHRSVNFNVKFWKIFETHQNFYIQMPLLELVLSTIISSVQQNSPMRDYIN